jgi:hypothetical protein
MPQRNDNLNGWLLAEGITKVLNGAFVLKNIDLGPF